ncbi:hypothetical protein [Paraburkholderia sartisoli]|uniref:Uncharacterized protein n=1 Tax=Paraburkholderia sartisoli TaxID=83784 RepID=A0A1H4CGB9_9BURK|nr:hypothetical protein [Paraburkholderia sartisoli]SEA59380.1 hypothetical protein SAMN05192564_102299 [Paraburkholderia sartisoli]
MSRPLDLDLRARAELLAYLVASHLLTREMTGEWLSVEHVVESTKLWLSSNGGGADLMQRVHLASQALDIAKRVALASASGFGSKTAAGMFCENLRLDFRSDAVREIYQTCLNQLVGQRWH